METIQKLDEALEGRALIFGSLPPEGRDLDLLVRPAEEHAAASALAGAGFKRRKGQWVRFLGCKAEVVDLVPAADWELPQGEIDDLFQQAERIAGFENLVRPSPHHTLLILARKTGEGADLTDRRRVRIEDALARNPKAWTAAEQKGPAWNAIDVLSGLKSAYELGANVRHSLLSRLKGAVARTRRGALVTLSGLDGSGKSSQAEALSKTLRSLGYDNVVVWNRLAVNPSLDIVAKPIKSLLRLVPRWNERSAPIERRFEERDEQWNPGTALRQRSVLVTEMWACVIAIWNAMSHRRSMQSHLIRGRVVISDRFVLDSAVNLRFKYGVHRTFRFQKWLVRFLSPRPTASFHLRVSAEVANDRKPIEYTLDELGVFHELYDEERQNMGITQLDGELPMEEVCETISSAVWALLD